jgi:hypothetical protein
VPAYKVSQRNPDEVRVSDPAGVGGSLCFMKVPEPMAARPGWIWTGTDKAAVVSSMQVVTGTGNLGPLPADPFGPWRAEVPGGRWR